MTEDKPKSLWRRLVDIYWASKPPEQKFYKADDAAVIEHLARRMAYHFTGNPELWVNYVVDARKQAIGYAGMRDIDRGYVKP